MVDIKMTTYLAEAYVPALDEVAAARIADALSAATNELRARGSTIELLHSFAVLREETCFSLFSAASAADVHRAAGLVPLAYDQLSEVVCYSRD